jgi:hypothetical protein
MFLIWGDTASFLLKGKPLSLVGSKRTVQENHINWARISICALMSAERSLEIVLIEPVAGVKLRLRGYMGQATVQVATTGRVFQSHAANLLLSCHATLHARI